MWVEARRLTLALTYPPVPSPEMCNRVRRRLSALTTEIMARRGGPRHAGFVTGVRMTLGLGGSVRASASSPPPTPSPLQPGGPDLLRLARQPRRVGAFEHIVQRKETPQEYLHEGISQGLESRQLAVEEEIRGRAVGGLSLCRPFASQAPLGDQVRRCHRVPPLAGYPSHFGPDSPCPSLAAAACAPPR